MFAQRRNRRRATQAAATPYARPDSQLSAAQSRLDLDGEDSASVAPHLQQQNHSSLAIQTQSATALARDQLQQFKAQTLFQGGSAITPTQLFFPTAPSQSATFTSPVKLSHVCRFCNCKLSSSSNRLRHERLKHASELMSVPNTPTAGGSRKQTCEGAFGMRKAAAVAADTELFSHNDEKESHDQQLDHEPAAAAAAESASSGSSSSSTSTRTDCEMKMTSAADHSSSDSVQDGNTNSSAAAAVDRESSLPAPQLRSGENIELELFDHTSKEHEDADSELSADYEANAVSESDATAPDPQMEVNVQPSHDQLQLHQDLSEALDHAQVLEAEGARPLLQETALQSVCYPFLQWLASPCMTACEALVKAKRVKSLSQLAPIKCSLRFIFALLYESKAIDSIDLRSLLRLSICQSLYQAIVDRQVGSGRTHQIFLLVKKLLVFLSSTESAKTRQFVLPSSYESYLYVENICSESSNQRKQEARNRMVLGIPGARGALTQPKDVFQIPKTWSASETPPEAAVNKSVSSPPSADAVAPARINQSPRSLSASPLQLRSAQLAETAAGVVFQPFRNALDALPPGDRAEFSAAAHQQFEISSNQVMTKEELSRVTKTSLLFLNRHIQLLNGDASSALKPEADAHFTHHLIVATLCLGLAPRSQVLQQLSIGSSFIREEDGRYWIRIRADQSKNGRPTMFSLATELTQAYDAYLQFARPRLLARSGAEHDYVFCKKNGTAPRKDFSSSTCLVTQQVIGRPVNAHTFRSSLITTFYSSGATEAEMSSLASIMAHDPATQRNFYYKPKHNEAAVHASQRMVEQLLQA